MNDTVSKVQSFLRESSDNEQLKNYMKIVQDMESTGLISKPLTPIRDTRPVFPNKAGILYKKFQECRSIN